MRCQFFCALRVNKSQTISFATSSFVLALSLLLILRTLNSLGCLFLLQSAGAHALRLVPMPQWSLARVANHTQQRLKKVKSAQISKLHKCTSCFNKHLLSIELQNAQLAQDMYRFAKPSRSNEINTSRRTGGHRPLALRGLRCA
jgi:hypothetical protein